MTELMISFLNPFHSYFKVGRHERHSGPSLTFHTVCRCAKSPCSNVLVKYASARRFFARLASEIFLSSLQAGCCGKLLDRQKRKLFREVVSQADDTT